jgi:hypothetical protein
MNCSAHLALSGQLDLFVAHFSQSSGNAMNQDALMMQCCQTELNKRLISIRPTMYHARSSLDSEQINKGAIA